MAILGNVAFIPLPTMASRVAGVQSRAGRGSKPFIPKSRIGMRVRRA
jgi:hypothetical protein